MSWVTDKAFRTIFLAVYSSVLVLPLWRRILPAGLFPVVLAFYLPSYLDGSEQREGRKSPFAARLLHWIALAFKSRFKPASK